MIGNGKAEISPLEPQHLSRLIKISDSAFGKGYYREKDIALYMNEWSRVATLNGKIAGFCLSEIAGPDSMPHIADWSTQKKNGVIKSVAVKQDLRGKGVGKLLLREVQRRLFQKVNPLFVFGWDKPDNSPLSFYKGEGFEYIRLCRNFWYEESLEKNYECSHCGQPPCTCSAVIMKKEKTL